MNASTADSSLVSIAVTTDRSGYSSESNAVALWLWQTLRVMVWGAVGLCAALAGYAFGIAAIVLGILWHMRVEEGWWPALTCLVLAGISARVSRFCVEFALVPGQQGRGGLFSR